MKRENDFLDKFQDEDKVRIKSNLYRLESHYLENQKTSVICVGDKCFYCSKGVVPRVEFLYIVERYRGESTKPEIGLARVPGSIFFAMAKNEKLLKKSKREFEWAIGREGEGKSTRYNVVRGQDVEIKDKEVEKANEKLKKAGDNYTKYLKTQYEEKSGVFKDSDVKNLVGESEPEDKIPF